MQIFDVLDHLDHTFAVELDRRRRIRRVSRSVAALEGQDPASYRGRRPEDLWEVPGEARRASHECLRTGEVQHGYEIWTAATGVQRVVQVARIPSRGVVVVVGEDVTDRMQRLAIRALQLHVSSRPVRTDVAACMAAGASLNDCCNALAVDIDTSLLTMARLPAVVRLSRSHNDLGAPASHAQADPAQPRTRLHACIRSGLQYPSLVGGGQPDVDGLRVTAHRTFLTAHVRCCRTFAHRRQESIITRRRGGRMIGQSETTGVVPLLPDFFWRCVARQDPLAAVSVPADPLQ